MANAAQIYARFKNDEISALSAQLSFYLLLSMFPFLLFVLNILSFTSISVLDLTRYFARFMPDDIGPFINRVITEMLHGRSPALISVGAVITVWSASRGVNAICRGLNKAYDKQESRPFWKITLMDIVFTFGITIMILIAFLLLIFGELIGSSLLNFLGAAEAFHFLWGLVRYTIAFIIMVFIFASLYKFVPNHHIRFKEVLPGAFFAALGWILSSLVFSLYVNNFASYAQIYGSIAAVIILLIWLYISSVIILLGGEINATLSHLSLKPENR